MKIRVRFFAVLREIVGSEQMEMELSSGATAEDLLEALLHDYPRLGPYAAVVHVAINQEFADRRARLDPEDEVAFLPPVSGGGSGEASRSAGLAKPHPAKGS